MNTKAFLIGTAAALALTPANAANFQGWYVGLEGGGNWIDETEVLYDGGERFQTTFETGWAALGTFGYAWRGWRGELELGYRANDLETMIGAARGEFNEFSHMLNVIYNCEVTDKVGLSLGAGAGGDYIMYEDDDQHTIPIHDTDWVFAWQAIAGINYHLGARTDIFLAYRYFTAHEPFFSEFDGGENVLHSDAYDDVVKHTATIGIRFALAGAAEPAYVAPPPPPPPPPPAAPASFIVFFGHNKSNLTPEAMDVIRQAAAAAKQTGAATISVVGHADRSGSAQYNDALALRRANGVGGALGAEGVPASAISISGRGEGDPMVPTADGVREPQNRRVNINM